MAPDVADAAVDTSELILLNRKATVVGAEVLTNDAFVDQRIASVRTYYEKSIAKKTELLTRGQSAGRQERYLRMLRGHRSRLEAEYEEKVEVLNTLRTVAAEHTGLAMGILEVEEEHRAQKRPGARAEGVQ